MPRVTEINLVGHQIGALIKTSFGNATIPGAAHTEIEIDYSDGTRRVLESGPDTASGKWLVPQDYADTSKPLFSVPITAPHRSLDRLAIQITNAYDNAESWRLPYDYNGIHYLADSVDANSGSILSGVLNHVGVDVRSVENQINAQGQQMRLVGGFDTPYNRSFDGFSYYDVPEYVDGRPITEFRSQAESDSLTTIRRFRPTPALNRKRSDSAPMPPITQSGNRTSASLRAYE